MNQIWIKFQNLDTKEIVTTKFWDADDAKYFIYWLKKESKKFRMISKEDESMNQIWIKFQNLDTKEIVTTKFWDADDAKYFIYWLKKESKKFRMISCGGFEDEDEMRYALGW